MEFKIAKTEVYGLNKSVIASGNAMRVEIEDNTKEVDENSKAFKRASLL